MSDLDYKTLESSIREIMRKAHRQPDLPKLEEEGLKPAVKKKAKEIGKVVDKIADDDYEKLKLAGEVMDQILGEGAESDDEETPKKGKVTCEHCGGTGMHEEKECEVCGGTGKVDIGDQMEEVNSNRNLTKAGKQELIKKKKAANKEIADKSLKQAKGYNPASLSTRLRVAANEENLDELSPAVKTRYIHKANKEISNLEKAKDSAHKDMGKDSASVEKHMDKKATKRRMGVRQARKDLKRPQQFNTSKGAWESKLYDLVNEGWEQITEGTGIGKDGGHITIGRSGKHPVKFTNTSDGGPGGSGLHKDAANQKQPKGAQGHDDERHHFKFKGKKIDVNDRYMTKGPKQPKGHKKHIKQRVSHAGVPTKHRKKVVNLIHQHMNEESFEEGGVGGLVPMKKAGKAVKDMEKSMGLKKTKDSGIVKTKGGYSRSSEYSREDMDIHRDSDKKRIKVKGPDGKIVWRNVRKQTDVSKKSQHDAELEEGTRSMATADKANYKSKNLEYGTKQAADTYARQTPGQSPGHDMDRDDVKKSAKPVVDGIPLPGGEIKKPKADKLTEETMADNKFDQPNIFGNNPAGLSGVMDAASKILSGVRDEETQAASTEEDHPIQKDLEAQKVEQEQEQGYDANGSPVVEEEKQMDPVDKKELKGKHKDRKDKDIDNDGDVDDSDKFLHKKRKAVSKAVKKDDEENGEIEEKLVHMCAKHVEHVEYGVGTCIPEMHTIVEQEDGTNVVTHYDVMFEDVLVQDIPVEELKVLEESHHGHMRKKKVKEEAPSKKQVRMAKGIAFDKRYKGGNMTGAVKAMDKINPKLSSHPKVKKALQHANEEDVKEFKNYNVTHKKTGKKYRVTAMHSKSAAEKARAQHGGSASRYSGTSTSDFHVEERLDELSPGLKKRYVKKAMDQIDHSDPAGYQANPIGTRRKGIARARGHKMKGVHGTDYNRKTDSIEKPRAKGTSWSTHFKKQRAGTAPHYKKSTTTKKDWTKKTRYGKVPESFEGKEIRKSLDELSPATKKSYIKKAGKDITQSQKRIDDLDKDSHTAMGSRGADNAVLRDIHKKNISKRLKGVRVARGKL